MSTTKFSSTGELVSGGTVSACLASSVDTSSTILFLISKNVIPSKTMNVVALLKARSAFDFKLSRFSFERRIVTMGSSLPMIIPPDRVYVSVLNSLSRPFWKLIPAGIYDVTSMVSLKVRINSPESRSKINDSKNGLFISSMKILACIAEVLSIGSRGLDAASSATSDVTDNQMFVFLVAKYSFFLISLRSSGVMVTSSTAAASDDLITVPSVNV